MNLSTLSKKALLFALPALAAALLAGCADNTASNTKETNQVATQQDIYTKNQPVHTYQYSNERAALLQLYDQRVTANLNTWTVWYSNSGIALGTCASKGYPIPYGTELTNPQQVGSAGDSSSHYGYGTVGQMDPNGIYPAANSLGTWIMCLAPDGSVHPVYEEPLVATYPYAVKIVNGQVVQTGEASAESAITLGGSPSAPAASPSPKK